MITRHRRKSPLRRLWLPLLAAGFLGYFSFHAFNGSLGIWAADQMESDAVRLKAELATLKAEREALERRTASLRPNSLDADVVDIESRLSLNMLRPDEVVISFGAVQQIHE
jgi:cell division protein FtsB